MSAYNNCTALPTSIETSLPCTDVYPCAYTDDARCDAIDGNLNASRGQRDAIDMCPSGTRSPTGTVLPTCTRSIASVRGPPHRSRPLPPDQIPIDAQCATKQRVWLTRTLDSATTHDTRNNMHVARRSLQHTWQGSPPGHDLQSLKRARPEAQAPPWSLLGTWLAIWLGIGQLGTEQLARRQNCQASGALRLRRGR
jgi:hypothetical protein